MSTNFKSYIQWINERKTENLSYGCVMLYAEINNWNKHIKIIDKKDVYEKDNDYGYEKDPHITILYGLHYLEIDDSEIYDEIKKMKPITTSISNISIFESKDYDVVKYDVPILKRLKLYRTRLMKYPNTQTFSDYNPHMTLAYVKSGMGKNYIQEVKPFKVTFNTGVYSIPDKRKKYFKL